MVILHSSNAILVWPFASKQDEHRIAAYTTNIYTRIATANRAPTMLQILDNEASAAFQRAITANNCNFQLVPPHVHNHNVAE
jgi:predicted TIM-barrel enzyme